MAWAKLDDGFHAHPKVMQAGLAATGLHVLAISYCSRYLTDGHVSAEFVRQVASRNASKLVSKLVEAGLWEVRDEKPDSGWIVHDYLDYNPSRAEVIAARRDPNRGSEPLASRAGASERTAGRARSRAGGGAGAGGQPRVPVPYPFPERAQA
jgi:hypothetical protein